MGWPGRKWTPEERRLVQEMRDQGVPYRHIAKVLGRTEDSCAGAMRDAKPDCILGKGPIRESDKQVALRKKLYGTERYA